MKREPTKKSGTSQALTVMGTGPAFVRDGDSVGGGSIVPVVRVWEGPKKSRTSPGITVMAASRE
jgi:hypothetical protein